MLKAACVLQDFMGVLFRWDLGVSPAWALQLSWSGGLLLFQYDCGDHAVPARRKAQQPCLERETKATVNKQKSSHF